MCSSNIWIIYLFIFIVSYMYEIFIENMQCLFRTQVRCWNKAHCANLVHSRWSVAFRCAVNSLWLSDTTWWCRSGSTLAQVMACCLTAPSHYLNQCWLIISEVLWHSLSSQFNWKFSRYLTFIQVWKWSAWNYSCISANELMDRDLNKHLPLKANGAFDGLFMKRKCRFWYKVQGVLFSDFHQVN